MKRVLEITEQAYSDVAASWTWYEDQREGLGDRFMVAYREALERIQSMPEIFSQVDARVRRAMMRRFPFGVYFLLEQERIGVIAVLHASRDPDELQRRVENL
jgi:toxin ParE1/3/4